MLDLVLIDTETPKQYNRIYQQISRPSLHGMEKKIFLNISRKIIEALSALCVIGRGGHLRYWVWYMPQVKF